MRPPPTAGLAPELAAWLVEAAAALQDLQQPQHPTALYACAQADLPPASAWENCALVVTDLDIVAVSNGSAWVRQDTGASL